MLIVSYVFPPMAAVGGYRVIKFCKFLPRFDWVPVVLTVKEGFNYAYDYSLLDDIDPSLNVYRSHNFEPLVWWDRHRSGHTFDADEASAGDPEIGKAKRTGVKISLSRGYRNYIRKMISIPDTCNFWVPFGILTGLHAVRKEKVDVIFSTSPPASAHLVAYVLSKITGLPLVVDLRDLWTQNESYELKDLPRAGRRFDRYLEKAVFRRARAIITTTDTFGDMVRESNPFVNRAAIRTITNGLDPDDFAGIKFPKAKNYRFTILHLGSLYGYRDPGFFLGAVRRWLERNPEVRDKASINFIGNTPGFEKLVEAERLTDVVSFVRHIPHGEVLQKLWEADLLLLILGFNDSVRGVIPAKLFEYVSTGQPILGLVPKGEAERIINRCQNGKAITNPDAEEMCSFLNDQYHKWTNSPRGKEPSFTLPPEFDRCHLTGSLAKILDEIVTK